MTALMTWAPDPAAWPGDGFSATRSLVALFVVFALLGLLVWATRRGPLARLSRRQGGAIAVETAVPLGERRSLVVVAVEGRRLLLGVSPVQVTLLTELGAAAPSFEASLGRAVSGPGEGVS